MIRTDRLSKIYRSGGSDEVRAVDDVSLTISAGRFVALTGPSGSGKSTLLAMLGALMRPTRGTIVLNDRTLNSCSDVELARIRREMGFVFQNFSLLPRLPVWENVTYPLVPRGVVAPERRELARRTLQPMGLDHKIDARPEQLSGGEQQRVAVARALAAEPKILLADEPTSNLDHRAAAVLTPILKDIHASGVTLIVSTHHAELIDLATDIFELNEGKLSCR